MLQHYLCLWDKASAIERSETCCSTDLLCTSGSCLHLGLAIEMGDRGCPQSTSKLPQMSLKWRHSYDMSLHRMLFSAIFYVPFLSAPVAFSVCYSLPCVLLVFLCLLYMCWAFLSVFFPPTGFCSHLCECHFLNSSLVFNDLFSSRVALDRQLVLHSRAETVLCLSIQPKIISSVFRESPSEGYTFSFAPC